MSPLSRQNRPVLLIGVAALVIAIGVQALLYQRDSAGEKTAQAQRAEADRAYARCLTRWGDDLVDSLQKLQAANRRLDAAEVRKDRALDTLISLSNQAQKMGAESQDDLPPAFIKRYEDTLAERVDAQHDFNHLKTRLAQTREANPYVAPAVTCHR